MKSVLVDDREEYILQDSADCEIDPKANAFDAAGEPRWKHEVVNQSARGEREKCDMSDTQTQLCTSSETLNGTVC